MQIEYTPEQRGPKPRRGRKMMDPEKYVTGPDPLRRKKYYAWLKHRAQAHYRLEEYLLEWPHWELIWSDEDFVKRGRGADSLCLMLVDREAAWSHDNVEVVTRVKQLQAAGRRKRGV
jgi:hypothetical protein